MKPELKARWVEALRSGKYTQSYNTLRSNHGYCCLGVLCDVYNPDMWVEVDGYWKYTDDENGYGSTAFLPTNIAEPNGIDFDKQVYLSSLNDVGGGSFAKIADHIEANL